MILLKVISSSDGEWVKMRLANSGEALVSIKLIVLTKNKTHYTFVVLSVYCIFDQINAVFPDIASERNVVYGFLVNFVLWENGAIKATLIIFGSSTYLLFVYKLN